MGFGLRTMAPSSLEPGCELTAEEFEVVCPDPRELPKRSLSMVQPESMRAAMVTAEMNADCLRILEDVNPRVIATGAGDVGAIIATRHGVGFARCGAGCLYRAA